MAETAKYTGMTISLSGTLGRAAERLHRTRDEKHLAWSLWQLNKHLDQLRDDQSPENVTRFFEIWSKH